LRSFSAKAEKEKKDGSFYGLPSTVFDIKYYPPFSAEMQEEIGYNLKTFLTAEAPWIDFSFSQILSAKKRRKREALWSS
jgi:aromatic ring-opening dioxygenase catalytic subunit (LigB family)